jgi:hypothetical protein
MQPNTKSGRHSWLPSRIKVLVSLFIATLLAVLTMGVFALPTRVAEGAILP